MRHVHRLELPRKVESYLSRRQAGANAQNIDRDWKVARQTQAFSMVVRTLQRMTGSRERCMYCVDSHGSDIDHFWPKSRYSNRAFQWSNMLLCCSECGRIKGSQFPLVEDEPLLVDPTTEDPWLHIDFDPDTGNLTARYDPASGNPSTKGEETVKVLQLDRREGIAEGYRRTYQRLVARVQEALLQETIDDDLFVRDMLKADDHGLMGWCFSGAGIQPESFAALHKSAPEVWAACVSAAWYTDEGRTISR